ncbi:MAG: flagellin [Acidimicrobiales bacterium]|nr:flagellin [Acidimicrobiales bacterium]
MRINQNTMAVSAHRNLTINDGSLTKSMEKLSSGFRINRAADDAAGLAKSEKLRADVRGINQAIKNAQDGISFVQTAEGALDEVHAILQRINELAVSAANTATSDGAAEQSEVTELLKQIDAIGQSTKFAGRAVFGASAVTFQVGSFSSDIIQVTTETLSSASLGASGSATDLSSISLSTAASAAIDTIRDAIDDVNDLRASLGANQNRLEHTITNLQVTTENLQASESRIRDLDIAAEMVSFTRHQIMVQAGTAMLAQANSVPQNVLQLLRG